MPDWTPLADGADFVPGLGSVVDISDQVRLAGLHELLHGGLHDVPCGLEQQGVLHHLTGFLGEVGREFKVGLHGLAGEVFGQERDVDGVLQNTGQGHGIGFGNLQEGVLMGTAGQGSATGFGEHGEESAGGGDACVCAAQFSFNFS